MSVSDSTPSYQQLSLPVRLDDSATFDNFFVTDGNGLALQAAKDAAALNDSAYLFGPPGSGRSHLLQAACHRLGVEARYLPLADLAMFEPAQVLDNAEHAALVALDDVDAVAQNPLWAEALFHLFNRLREAGGRCLISAGCSPRQLSCALPDLQSRLSWHGAVRVSALDEEQRLAALRWRAQCRGLELSEEVARFILSRFSRDPAALFALLDQLDRRSLELQRRLTVAFVRQVLADLA